MKKPQISQYSLFFVLFFSIHSCITDSPKNQNTEIADTAIMVAEKQEITLPETPLERKFEFSEMQGKWWLLTTKESGLIRYNHWDAQDETIVFETDNDGVGWLEISYAQETDAGPVTDFKAIIIEGDGISMVKGSFTFKGGLDNVPKQINFTWNQYQYFATFENLINTEDDYVPDVSKDFFPYEETFREED